MSVVEAPSLWYFVVGVELRPLALALWADNSVVVEENCNQHFFLKSERGKAT